MKTGFKFSDSIQLIKNIRTTGTITPSSTRLVNRLLSPIDFSTANCIIELGPGNGCVTRALLARMRRDSTLICLEVNDDFVTALNKFSDPRLHVHRACASTIRTILDSEKIHQVDHVVSSLPLALLTAPMVANILNVVGNNLRDGGKFLQYQYSLKNYHELKPRFSNVKLKFTLGNMPPAFVYECIK